MFAGEVAIVLRFDFTTVVGLDVTTGGDPGFAEGGEAFGGVAVEGGIAPGAGAVVDADGFVLFDATVESFGGREFNFAHGDFDIKLH